MTRTPSRRLAPAGPFCAAPRIVWAHGRALIVLVVAALALGVCAGAAAPAAAVAAQLTEPQPAPAGTGVTPARATAPQLDRLLVLASASRPALGSRLRHYLSRTRTIVLLLVLVGCSLVLVLMRRRTVRRLAGHAPPSSGRQR